MREDIFEQEGVQEDYMLLKPYIDAMEVEFLDITPISLEAFYQARGSKIRHSYAFLERAIRLHRAIYELEVASRNEWE